MRILISLKRILIEKGIGEVILNSLEQMPFGNQRSHLFIFINVFHHLMKSGGDDRVAVNPRSFQQQVVRGVSVNDLTCYLRSQVLNLTSGFDFPHRARTISIETILWLSEWRLSVVGDPQMLHDPAGHNAQRESRINLNTTQFR